MLAAYLASPNIVAGGSETVLLLGVVQGSGPPCYKPDFCLIGVRFVGQFQLIVCHCDLELVHCW